MLSNVMDVGAAQKVSGANSSAVSIVWREFEAVAASAGVAKAQVAVITFGSRRFDVKWTLFTSIVVKRCK